MTQLGNIIARLEKFCGEETMQAIDADIASAVGWSPGPAYTRYGDAANWRIDGHVETIAWPPAYTHSIDAALTLVPEGWHFHLGHCSEKENDEPETFWAKAYREEATTEHDQWSARVCSPAIALCIAALKARLALSSPSSEPAT